LHGEYHDDVTGLVYYGYRYYAPHLHRWLSKDPIGYAGGLNLYGFVGNDPINAWDWLGLESQMEQINKLRLELGLPPLYGDGTIPTIICHGRGAKGPLEGVPPTYSSINGRVYDSGDNQDIIGIFPGSCRIASASDSLVTSAPCGLVSWCVPVSLVAFSPA
jgi:RHS repeat-associated protein